MSFGIMPSLAKRRQRFLSLLQAAAGPADDPSRLQVLTQVARAQGLQGKFSEAHATLDIVGIRLDTVPAAAGLAVPRVRYFLERGRVLNSDSEATKARPLFERAWHLARAEGLDFFAVDAAHTIGIVRCI